jgi:hypothetical protein
MSGAARQTFPGFRSFAPFTRPAVCFSFRQGLAFIASLIAFESVAIGQLKPERLRSLYGPPISETFVLRPDVRITVNYARDGSACGIDIRKDNEQGLVQRDVLEKILSDVIPSQMRGQRIQDQTIASGGAGEELIEYEHVNITRTFVWGGNRVLKSPSATVTFKAAECASGR